MAKKQDRYIYNIDNVNLEIDYDKLADAIIKAQKKADDEDKKSNYFRGLIMFGFNSLISLVAVCLVSGFAYAIWHAGLPAWLKFSGICFCIFCDLLIIMAIFESFRDKNEDIMTYFNTNIGWVALIIALVALVRLMN